jgi:hypothetical protein
MESFAVAPSQYLGHYVAGMIARRHEISVRLDSSGYRGTTATVALPSSLLSAVDESSLPVPAGATRGVAAAPPPPLPAAPPPSTPGNLHPGGRASVGPNVGTYRVGEAEFGIDFGTLDRSQVPPATSDRRARVPVAPTFAAPAQGAPAATGARSRALPVASTAEMTAIGEAQRARYVRDTLSRFSAGLEKGRDASAHEHDDRAPGEPGPTPAPDPGGGPR